MKRTLRRLAPSSTSSSAPPGRKRLVTRYAPSPTGGLHLGGLRTALYNVLLAHSAPSEFILRIEDTDQSRLVPGSTEAIVDGLATCGLFSGKRNATHTQSKRLDVYAAHAEQLIDAKRAYRCFCSKERIDQLRTSAKRQKIPYAYDGKCRHLTKDEVDEKMKRGEPHTVRLLVDAVDDDKIGVSDALRGKVHFSKDDIDDQVLVKSDGFPTYHLASVVDDHLMGITHVVRGEEWLPSTPKHALLYATFDWEMPTFVHLPLLLNSDGSKLSKRQGHVSVDAYLDDGYLPSALVNFVALLGWSPKNDKEIFFSVDEIASEFSLDRLNVSNAQVDRVKLGWINARHIRHALENEPEGEASRRIVNELRRRAADDDRHVDEQLLADDAHVLRVLLLMSEKVKRTVEFWSLCDHFFFDALDLSDPDAVRAEKKLSKDAAAEVIKSTIAALEQADACVDRVLADQVDRCGGKIAAFMPLRWALTGRGAGAPLGPTISALGIERSVFRLKEAAKHLG